LPKCDRGEAGDCAAFSSIFPTWPKSRLRADQASLESQKAFVAPVTPELTPAKYAERRASVEKLLAGMAAETEKRRDWWRQPVPGWADGRLEILGIDGKTTIIEFVRPAA
jgi:hypothetical protein